MKRVSVRSFSQRSFSMVVLAIGVCAASQAFESPLLIKMQAMGAAFKSIASDVRAIKAAPTALNDAKWKAIAANGQKMMEIAEESKTLYPSTVAGNPTLEKEFRDTLEDLKKTIGESLIKAAEQKELAATEAAVALVTKKRNTAHAKFMPE